MRRGEQAVDQLLIGIWGLVVDEIVDFLRRRRQAVQVEGDAADERRGVRFWRWLHPGRFQLGKDEGINECAAPGLVLDHRNLGPRQRAQRPPIGADDWFAARGGENHAFGPGSAVIDPFAQIGNFLIRQWLALLGHPWLRTAYHAHQQTLGGLARHDRRPMFAAGKQMFAVGQVEAAARLLAVVAADAALPQDRRHLVGEVGFFLGQGTRA